MSKTEGECSIDALIATVALQSYSTANTWRYRDDDQYKHNL